MKDEQLLQELDGFAIELPSWGFANTGTRFGKFVQPAAATNIEEKLSDAAQVNKFTGCCPTVALHVLWDFADGLDSVDEITRLAETCGIRIGSINPNVFQDQVYKHGSLGNEDAGVRQIALDHIFDCVEIAQKIGSTEVVLWFADGSNYPGTAHLRQRRSWFEEGLRQIHGRLAPEQRLLVEYKPFEPAFYHTDIADWGMALLLARAAGPQARVLVDTGHHYQSQNIEQIVAWLLAEKMLGGFHFNDRRYADDDLTLGSVDPYQTFRILHEMVLYRWETGTDLNMSFMVDQSHNLKVKIEAMIQTVVTAQELYAKACLVDRDQLIHHQQTHALIDAEECLKRAFATDVGPLLEEWRHSRGLPRVPLIAFRESGYLERITKERKEKNQTNGSSYA